MENPRKNTESKIAALLGVSLQTISVWLGTNSNIGNSSLLDARVKVPPKARPKLALDQTKELDNPAFFAIIARVKRIESCLFDNPKSKARAGLTARTTALSIRVHSPGLFKETNS